MVCGLLRCRAGGRTGQRLLVWLLALHGATVLPTVLQVRCVLRWAGVQLSSPNVKSVVCEKTTFDFGIERRILHVSLNDSSRSSPPAGRAEE